jgi:subtilisin-like proprotein convertase family protein
MSRSFTRLALVTLLLTLGGCQNVAVETPDDFGNAPVSELAPLMDGVPPQDELSDESKVDEVYPQRFDLLDTQSPVRDQGERGTCTAFTAIGLMESIYRSERLSENPDFSEQFLHWSVKNELGFGARMEGSSVDRVVETLNRFGVVEEGLWPYESVRWTTEDDPQCVGDSRPTRCYTNGNPPAAARSATRSFLASHRYVRSTRRSIQGHMVTRRTPVAIGGDMFYQAWNHVRSNLSRDYESWRAGIIRYPNAADIADSREDPSGHAVLIVGWDEDMEVPQINENGEQVIGTGGQPEMERGFFLIKNSWGTDSFGADHPMGAGYGWISMRYVEEFMWAYISAAPGRELPEVCNNRIDDDSDGQLDCDDSDCVTDAACNDGVTEVVNTTSSEIPDNRRSGVIRELYVNDAGTVSSVAITVDIAHPHRGDLRLTLQHEDRTVTLLDRVGGADDDVRQTFSVADFNGMPAAGTWRLTVVDTKRGDVGMLNSWGITITRCVTATCSGVPQTRNYEAAPAASIPDDDSQGIGSEIVVTDAGTISQLRANIAITHTFPMDLTVRLSRVGGREFVLMREALIEGPSVERSFVVDGFIGEAVAGTWHLTVIDTSTGDVGTLDRWSLDITTR